MRTGRRRKPSVPQYGPPPPNIRRRIGLATMRGANGSTIGALYERDSEIASPGNW